MVYAGCRIKPHLSIALGLTSYRASNLHRVFSGICLFYFNISVFARTSGTDDVTSGGITARNFHTNIYELVSNA